MAFRTSVSGLRAASADLAVTGNNIANANTTGFKTSRSQFADVYAASTSSKTAIGSGVRVASVTQQFSQGNIAFTDQNLDLAISGQGFFVLDENGSQSFSRAGAFGLDENGFIVNSIGMNLVGYQASNGAVNGSQGVLQISTGNLAPQPSTQIDAVINVDADDSVTAAVFDPADPLTYNNVTSLAVFDSLGSEHLARLYFKKTSVNAWDMHLRVDGDNTQTNATQNLAFNSSGALTTAMPVNFGAFTPTTGAAAFTLDINLNGTTQVGADFGVNALSQDGYSTGQLTGVDIDDNGTVLARYSNGQAQAQGQVVLASFANPQGLDPISDTTWAMSTSSGVALIGAPGSSSLGLIQGGALEDANTDMSQDLVNMIISQRAFQANAQMIRTEDEVTQTIINIR